MKVLSSYNNEVYHLTSSDYQLGIKFLKCPFDIVFTANVCKLNYFINLEFTLFLLMKRENSKFVQIRFWNQSVRTTHSSDGKQLFVCFGTNTPAYCGYVQAGSWGSPRTIGRTSRGARQQTQMVCGCVDKLCVGGAIWNQHLRNVVEHGGLLRRVPVSRAISPVSPASTLASWSIVLDQSLSEGAFSNRYCGAMLQSRWECMISEVDLSCQ
ncbi:Hypothetical_protein [Hexamita inflata]|uniref:Hypothetical_protein n=1 Tax=Hexamita inflata TaxID=28002 RepID=A0AA86TMI9_9EUKA|nr:Hypothetical protein HINF_LOCUS10738 [Hexamita inflata]CAI9923094.1 Hypothetical protein HINF_LOCUS10739 [Hexamita inflata]